jgi:hypothetical protein
MNLAAGGYIQRIRTPRSLHLWLAACLLLLTALFLFAGSRATVVADGTRYHFLDDDQMISMRYARNLAEGHGPVWNAGGERVEGYTNFGWMAVMSAVHRLGATDARAALWVRAINWMLACLVLVLTARLLVTLGLGHGMPAAAVLLALALSNELLFWAVNGFETTLLTVLFLGEILLALRDGRHGRLGAATCAVAGLLPVVRADAVDLAAAVVLTAVAVGARRRLWLVGLAAAPLVANEVFRLAYYGDWLPNTYYLKVAGRSGLVRAGLGNVKGFFAAYAVAMAFAAAACIGTADRRLRVIGCLVAFGFVRLLLVGPDIFPGFRFLAPYVPLLLVAAAAAAGLAREPMARHAMAAALLLATVFNAGVSGTEGLRNLVSLNGRPAVNTITGVLLNRHAMPTSTIAVTAAGCLPYFSRLTAIDLLGKSDRHVARVSPATPEGTGHNRFDIEWSLRSRPDFVASPGSYALASNDERVLQALNYRPSLHYGAALLMNPTFLGEYREHPVPVAYLMEQNAVFVHAQSPELARFGEWSTPVVRYP